MTNINNLINEIKEIEKNNFEDKKTFLIKTSDVLENLKQYEVSDYVVLNYNEDTEEYEEEELNSIDNYLDWFIDNGYINVNKSKCDNTYNWDCNITNDIDYRLYYNEFDGDVLIELKIHKSGDIRINYTNNVLLKFEDEDAFFQALQENNYIMDTIEIDDIEYSIFASFFDEYVIVYPLEDESNEKYIYEYEYEYIIDEIKKEFNH